MAIAQNNDKGRICGSTPHSAIWRHDSIKTLFKAKCDERKTAPSVFNEEKDKWISFLKKWLTYVRVNVTWHVQKNGQKRRFLPPKIEKTQKFGKCKKKTLGTTKTACQKRFEKFKPKIAALQASIDLST